MKHPMTRRLAAFNAITVLLGKLSMIAGAIIMAVSFVRGDYANGAMALLTGTAVCLLAGGMVAMCERYGEQR